MAKTEEVVLPDGSAFAVMSMPLPKDHWLTKPGHDNPPMLLRMSVDTPAREILSHKVREAVKYGLRGATMNGAEDDLDPDALVQNVIVGLFGYHTDDGLSNEPAFNPENIPKEWVGDGERFCQVPDELESRTTGERYAYQEGVTEGMRRARRERVTLFKYVLRFLMLKDVREAFDDRTKSEGLAIQRLILKELEAEKIRDAE
jgi:hypothetical protein